MPQTVPIGGSRWLLCDRFPCDVPDVLTFDAHTPVYRWLRAYQPSHFDMLRLRSFLSRHTVKPAIRMSDRAVMEALVDLVAIGRLHLHLTPQVEIPTTEPVLEPDPVPFPLRKQERPRTTTREPAYVPSNLPSNLDTDAQAAALAAAAESGAPFCVP